MCCNFGIDVDTFNPKILFTFEKKYSNKEVVNVHDHDFMSITYVLSGSSTYIINNVPYKVKKGDILLLNPRVAHGKTITSKEMSEFHAGFENFKLENLPLNHIIQDGVTPVIPYTKYDHDLINCFNDIISEQNHCENGSELILKALGMKLLVTLIRATAANQSIKENGSLNFETYDRYAIVNAITEFINLNYMNNMSLEIISQNMYLSPAYISKLFKEETGDSPINYLIKIRLSKAKEYLKNGSKTIKEAAQAVGYEDAYHFSKLFKKYYGYSPSCLKSKKSACR